MDGSESATDALRWAAAEAALRQQPLVIVNVYSPRIGGYPGDASGALLEVLRTSSAEVLTDAVAAVKAHQPDLTVTALTRTGGVIPFLIEEARGKELAVVGSRGLGGFTGLLLGSVGMGLASHAPCPVAVIRGTAPLPSVGSPAPVVVGVDGSHDADRALLAAFREARLRRCPLRVVHAWQDPTTDIYTTDDDHRVKLEEFDESAWRSYAATTLDAGLAPTLATFPDVEVEQVVDWRRADDRPAGPRQGRPTAGGRQPRPRSVQGFGDGIDQPGDDPARAVPGARRALPPGGSAGPPEGGRRG